jgi:hypothetical protein
VVAEALRAAGAKVEVHLDHFRGDMPDIEWIPEVAKRNWVLITKDQNIRRNPLERTAYEAAKLRGFIVTGKDMNAKELGALTGRPGPLLFTISRGGTFTKLI